MSVQTPDLLHLMRYGFLDDEPHSVARRFRRYELLRKGHGHVGQRLLRVNTISRQWRRARKLEKHVPETQTRASVLVGLHYWHNRMCVILTVRAKGISPSGEVSLPGGKRDPEDNGSDVRCALREAEEEIGLKSQDLTVLSTLTPIVSRNLVLVTPVVAMVSPEAIAALEAAPGEVARVFHCPLRMFIKASGTCHMVTWNKIRFSVPQFEFGLMESLSTVKIWGLSAKICIRVAEIALNLTAKKQPAVWSSSPDDIVSTTEILIQKVKSFKENIKNWRNPAAVPQFEPVSPPPMPPGCCFWLYQTELVKHMEWLVEQMALAKQARQKALSTSRM